ncbi:MAG TPA: HAD family hydrolase [Thermoplasmata archaeon]|nr:HAD family hydrolase [Thermoplasmata archaeon]
MTGGPVRIRVVLFDLGGTLVDERDFSGWVGLARELFVDVGPDELAHAFSEVETAVDLDPLALDREAAVVAFWRRVLSRAAGREVESATADRFCNRVRATQADKPFPVFSDVRRCLASLAAERRRLGIVSNSTSEATVRAILYRASILDPFERIVSSGTEGVAKPDPEIFRRAVARMGVRPEETFYVGNLAQTDAAAAAAAGLHSAWLHRDGTGLSENPREITSLLEVPLVIRALERGGTVPDVGARSRR